MHTKTCYVGAMSMYILTEIMYSHNMTTISNDEQWLSRYRERQRQYLNDADNKAKFAATRQSVNDASRASATHHRRGWSKSDDVFLFGNYHAMTARELSAVLSRSVSSIENRARTLNLRKNRQGDDASRIRVRRTRASRAKHDQYAVTTRRQATNQSARWTDGDEQFLKDNYATMSAESIALHLHRTHASVTSRVKVLGLRKNKKRQS